MPQLPSIPAAVGVESPLKTTTKTPESLQKPAGFAAEAEVMPFQEALQQSLVVAEGQADAAMGWFGAFPLEQTVTPLALESGKFLPFNAAVEGKSLPLGEALVLQTGNPAQLLQGEQVKQGGVGTIQPEFLMDRFIAVKDGDQTLRALSGESLLQASDVRAGTELTGQFSVVMSQAGASVPGVKSSMLMLPVDTPVGQPGWEKAVGERIQWMLGRQIQHAEVKLTPPNLGPLEIRISVHQDQASVSFMAAQAPTREALEAAIPRLREMFGDANLNLANVDVGHREDSRSSHDQAAGSATDVHGGVVDTDNDANQIASQASQVVSRGLVDHYV